MVLIDWLSKVRSNVTKFPVGTRLKKRKAFRSHHSIESLESRPLLSGVMANPDSVSTEAYQYEPVIIDALANDTSDVSGLFLASVGTTSTGHAEIIHIPAADASIEETDAYNNYVLTYGAPADRDFIVYTPYTDFIGDESFTYVAQDSAGNQATSTATVTFTDPYASSYDQTQQLAEDILGEEYASVEEEFYDSASQYADETEGNNTDPDYDAALENSPLEDLTDPFDDELTQEEYDALADETLDDATSEDTTDSGTDDTPVDPRLQWTPFAFTSEIAFPTASLPAEAMLDDLFSLTPDGTENFSITTEDYAAPIVEELTHDAGAGTKQTAAHTSTTLSQEWVSPDEWIVTQSITRYFESEENSDLTDGSTDTIGRSGSTTLTISVINGTHTIVTYTISDSFSYNNIYEWDNYADATDPDANPGSEESASSTGDATEDDEEEFTPADNGRFEYGFQNSSSLSVTLEQVLITLPDGRLATQYSLNYSTSSSFSASVSAKQEFREQEGTLAKFVRAVPTTDSDTVGDDGTTDSGTAADADPTYSDTDDGTDPTANQDVFDYDHGGNGSLIDFSADYGFNSNFSSNFNLNLTTIVPEDELIDDQVVTGSGAYGLSSGTTTSSQGGLSIQVQESGGDPNTDTHNHAYITYSSSTDDQSSGDFSFDMNFDIDSSATETTTGETEPTGEPESSEEPGTEETETNAETESTTATDSTSSSAAPEVNFDFDYSTANGLTLSATLMYSNENHSTGAEPTHYESGTLKYSPATYEETDIIFADGEINVSGGMGFTLTGLEVSGQTSGTGQLITAHRSITRVELPDSFSANSVSVSAVETLSLDSEIISTSSNSSFNASVTISLSLTSLPDVQGSASAEHESITNRVWQMDWHSWETDEDANVTYDCTGTHTSLETETYTLTANLTDGIHADYAITTDGYGHQVVNGEPGTVESNPTTTEDSASDYFIINFLSAIPETFADGSAYDSLRGAVSQMADMMTLGTTSISEDYGALFGNEQANDDGEWVGVAWGAFNFAAIAAYELPLIYSSLSGIMAETMTFELPFLATATAEGAVLIPSATFTVGEAIGVTSLAGTLFFAHKIDWDNFDEFADDDTTNNFQKMQEGDNTKVNEFSDWIKSKLPKDKHQQFHDEITKQGLSRQEIIERVRDLFGIEI